MRAFLALTAAFLGAACGGDVGAFGAGGQGGAATGAGGAGGAVGAGGEGGSTVSGVACIAGQQLACPCPGGGDGAQRCHDDGSGFGPCEGCGGAGGSGAQGGASAGGAGGAPPRCAVAADCPGADTDCASRTCVDGVCGVQYIAAGTPVPNQIPGDCALAVCDGLGQHGEAFDGADLPDDANDCTDDACAAAGPMFSDVATGTPCSSGLCKVGACVAHIPVDCFADGKHYIGCDGLNHADLTITWGDGSDPNDKCFGLSNDVAYCPPDTLCVVAVNSAPGILGKCK